MAHFYTERGQDHPPEKTFTNEGEACNYFHDFVMNMRHFHLVGFYKSEEKMLQDARFLQQHDIATTSDKIPYGGPTDLRYRLFVEGKAIFAAQKLLPSLPLSDQQ